MPAFGCTRRTATMKPFGLWLFDIASRESNKTTPARVSRSCVPDEDSLRRVSRMLLLFVVVAYFALVMLALLSDRIIFQPHPSSYQLSDLTGSSSVQPVILTSGPVNISAVYLPNVSARYTLLFSHGNAEDLWRRLAHAERASKGRFRCLRL